MTLQRFFPTRALALLMFIGFIDLTSTAMLYRAGLIVELNPLMRPVLEQSTFLFGIVKGATLVVAWYVMQRYAQTNLPFVRRVCVIGSAAYLLIWTTWFIAGK